MLKKFLKSKWQRGSSVIFFAISVPILFAFVGAAADFGWLYLNQSRLQSAADAAVTAGAAKLIQDEQPLSDYSYTTFVANSDDGLQTLMEAGTVSNRKTASGDTVAKAYAKANLMGWLGSEDLKIIDTSEGTDNTENAWNIVKFRKILYGKNTDDYQALYYTVTLSEELEHLFSIMDYLGFEPMQSRAMAAVKITHVAERTNMGDEDSEYPHGPSLYIQMKAKEEAETYATWEDVKVAKNGNATAANNRSVLTGGAAYTAGNLYRTEVSLLNGNAFASSRSNPYNTGVDQKIYDDLFIDFQGEMNKGMSLGIDVDLNISKTSGNWDYGDALTGNLQYSYRVHFPICIDIAYPIRSNKEPPDSLYAFIEQEPITRTVKQSDGTTYNRGNMSSARQIIINANVANTNVSYDRPIVFFYEGPEIATPEENPNVYDDDGDYIGVRPYLPVIFNLYADFRGIVFAPNNPIVINGNGHKFEGFVVGSEFKRLKTAADFESEGYVKVTYNGSQTAYVKQDSLVAINGKFTKLNSATTAPSNYVKIKTYINNSWCDAFIESGQWYTNNNPYPDDCTKINDSGTERNGILSKTILASRVKYNGQDYAIKSGEKFYVAVNSESVTYSSGTVITQKIQPEMYISGTAYSYTEKYTAKSGKEKDRTVNVAIGDVQFMDIDTVEQSKDSEGHWSESPGDTSSFKDDDALRYDYVSIFNLDSSSTYNSFLNVGLVNYTYLAKNEFGTNTSHDMFFTTERSKHID